MSPVGAASGAALSSARAEASRRNGARSRGPKTPEGKARSARNALKHGLRAEKFVVVGDEDPEQFEALETALGDELAPEGALQGLLAGRIARAAWRLERAERIEAELFTRQMDGRNLGLALIRDGHGPRAFDTLLRYRGTALAELWRALRLLKALQAERPPYQVREDAPAPLPRPQADASAGSEPLPPLRPALHEMPPARLEKPIEPEARRNPGEIVPVPPADQPDDAPDVVPISASGCRPCGRRERDRIDKNGTFGPPDPSYEQ